MQIARVHSHVVVTRKHTAYKGRKLLQVHILDRHQRETGDVLVAVDMVDAGVGDLVLTSSEGRWAREHCGDDAPVRSTIVAVLEGVDCEDSPPRA